MRQKHIAQTSIFDSGYVDHQIARELAAISAWLDAHPKLLDHVARDIDPSGTHNSGRDGLSLETILRCAILKQYRQVSYRELEFLLNDSRSFQHFARLDVLRVPGKSALQQTISRIRAETWEALNHRLLNSAASSGIEQAQRIRIDATVVETHILRPSDSGLLLDAVRVMTRQLRAAQSVLGKTAVSYSNHLRVAKRRHRAILASRNAARRATLYQELLNVVTIVMDYINHAAVAVRRYPEILWRTAWLADTRHYAGLIVQVVDQTQRRVLQGEKVPAGDKTVSLFEEHTDIIVKGGRDVQYGHKVNLCTGVSGMVLDAVIETGNPPDTDCLMPMLQRHIRHYGQAPRDLATDGGYASSNNLEQAKALNVINVAFHKKKGLDIEAMTSDRWLYYKLKRFRAGIEAGISYLKRCFGLSRCNWRGLAHYRAYVWSSVFTHNLVVYGRLTTPS